MSQENLKQLKRIAKSYENPKSPYLVGLYNGIEMVLAVIENRKPEFHEVQRKVSEVK